MMATQNHPVPEGKILILATETCAYPGADSVGQAHSSYPANTYILRVRSPVLFPEQFYLDCFKKGISGIIIMSCGGSDLSTHEGSESGYSSITPDRYLYGMQPVLSQRGQSDEPSGQ